MGTLPSSLPLHHLFAALWRIPTEELVSSHISCFDGNRRICMGGGYNGYSCLYVRLFPPARGISGGVVIIFREYGNVQQNILLHHLALLRPRKSIRHRSWHTFRQLFGLYCDDADLGETVEKFLGGCWLLMILW